MFSQNDSIQVHQRVFRITDYNLQRLFKGEMFKNAFATSFAPSTIKYEFKTSPNKITHIFDLSISTNSSAMNFQFIENAIKTDSAITISTPYNVNRNSGTTTGSIFTSNPTTSTGGTPNSLLNINLQKGKSWRFLTSELILPKNTGYLVKLINSQAVGLGTISFSFVYYETKQ